MNEDLFWMLFIVGVGVVGWIIEVVVSALRGDL